MQISKRLSVEGPDSDGDYELTWLCGDCDRNDSNWLTRAEADALILALQPPQPVAPDVTDQSGRPIAPPQSEPAPRPSGNWDHNTTGE